MKTLLNDQARCKGKWINRNNEMHVKGECKNCLRRTARPVDEIVPHMLPPAGNKCPERIDDAA